jgi:hypothetical protein
MIRNTSKLVIVHLGDNKFLDLKRDIILGIYHTLLALGYDVVISNNMLDKNRLNIIIGLDITSREIRTQLQNSQIDYIVYETEIIHNGALNFRPKAAIDLELDYLPALAKAKLVLSPFKYVVNTLKNQYGINAIYVKWGYVPELNDIKVRKDDQKGIDCYFFGILTKKRNNILQEIMKSGLKVKITDFPGIPVFLRNHFISRSKLVLSLQHNSQWMTVNPYRIMYPIQNNCCVVTEKQSSDLDGYNDYAVVAETQDFVKYCSHLIHSKEYQILRQEKQTLVMAEPMIDRFKGLI